MPVPHYTKPYWRCDPHELDNVRTTPDLPTECEIAIIGSGMTGIATAYHILKQAEHPPKIVILEARELCSGATGRNGGHIKVKVPTLVEMDPNLDSAAVDEFQEYVHSVIEAMKQVIEEEQLDCEFELRRSFDIQTDEAESQRLKKHFDESRKAGRSWVKSVDFIDHRTVQQITSMKNATSAFSVPAASLWPYKFVTQLLARLLARHPSHLNVQTRTPVLSATPSTSSPTSSTSSHTLRTPRGTLTCSNLIFATNAYTPGLLPSFTNIITPYKGMASHLIPRSPIHPHLTHTYNIDHGPSKGVNYLNPRPDGSIVVGGAKWTYSSTDPWDGDFDDGKRFSASAEAYWDAYMQRNFLGWEGSGARVGSVWVGIMARTKDGWPWVGRVPGREGAYMVVGFNGGGMPVIWKAGECVAGMV
ncbi:FAD dependent oxidoreductase superfamily, partial [Polyplosphaeria fusca]